MGDYAKAIADYTGAIRLDPADASTYYNRSLAHLKNGERTQAADDFDQAKKRGFKP
jgi:tetratricopeptide (TPR) repeat protein